jgi:hypothetical protein
MITWTDALMIAAVSGAVSGLISWGGVRVELRWLRRDVDRANSRHDERDERERAERIAAAKETLSTLKRS